jgi:predicted GIY-YIG superfamily endonuclease
MIAATAAVVDIDWLLSSTALYRYFDDCDRLLYIGITGDLAVRETGHIRASAWMVLTVRSTVARYGSWDEAADAERAAILAERPLFNRKHNDTPQAAERLETYLAERGLSGLLTYGTVETLSSLETGNSAEGANPSRPVRIRQAF